MAFANRLLPSAAAAATVPTTSIRGGPTIRYSCTAWSTPILRIAMPELGRSTVHAEGIALMRAWVAAMPGEC